jgi:hypothetical protein
MTCIGVTGLISGQGWKAQGKIDDADIDPARPLDLSLPTLQRLTARQLYEMFKAILHKFLKQNRYFARRSKKKFAGQATPQLLLALGKNALPIV